MGMRPLIWTPGRWWAVIFSLAVAPFFFHYVELTSLQGYGLGWIVAAVVATPLSIVRQSPTPDTPKEYSKVLSVRVELCALCSGVLAGELGRLMRSGLL